MKTLFLQFTNEEGAEAVLAPYVEAGLITDVVGRLYTPVGDDPDAAPTPLPGWHVNVLADQLPEALQPYEVFPEKPARVFAIEPPRSAPDPAPHSCTRRQGLLALLTYGHRRADTEALIAEIPGDLEREAALIEYEAATWERSNQFLQQMWAALGGAPEQLDEVFRVAVTL